MTTAYSYTRFSTAEQQFGDSERRQLALAESYCARNGLKLADTISDKGISAFHGRHRQSGALGRLLKRLKPGDALIVEDSDRLSREAPLTALTALYAAVNGGIEVHFLRTGTVVNAANFNDVSVIVPNFFGSLLANQESKKKGERVKASWAARRAAIAKGLPARFRLPCWLEWSAEQGKVTVNEAKAAIVKRLFRLAGEGHGVLAIARLLNQEGVKPITGSKRACWNLTSLRRILLGKEAIGFYVPGTGEPVANYFPAVVSEAEFYAAQSRLGDAKKIKARTASTANLFVGLAHCRRCGAAMTTAGRLAYSKLCCQGARSGRSDCKFSGVPLRLLEKAVFELLSDKLMTALFTEQKPSRVAELQGKLAGITAEIDKAASVFWQAEVPQLIADKINRLQTEQKAIGAEIEAERAAQAAQPVEAWRDWIKGASLYGAKLKDPAARPELRRVLHGILARVEADPSRRGNQWQAKLVLKGGSWAEVKIWRGGQWRLLATSDALAQAA